ncbi:MAG: alpha/beta hydrolase-fold protein [Gemmatimonadota bacterium]
MAGIKKGVPFGGTPPVGRYTMEVRGPERMHSSGFDWDFETEVALPASYGDTSDRAYPVLWLTDGPLVFNLAVGIQNLLATGGLAPELIIVGVGCSSAAGLAEYSRRRVIELTPPGNQLFYDGPGGDYFKKLAPEYSTPQRADAFLAFLVDEARPALAKQYRMIEDHGLFGHSGGGMFANYALFARPGTFRRYIIGSPSSNAVDRAAFKLEAAHAAAHRDLQADVFFGAGEAEIGEMMLAAWGIVSAPVLMAETLLLRQYPSLKITTRIFSAKNHFTAVPDILLEGIQAVWGNDP